MAAEEAGQALSGMQLPWEATADAGAEVCGNFSLLAALHTANDRDVAARLPPAGKYVYATVAASSQLSPLAAHGRYIGTEWWWWRWRHKYQRGRRTACRLL